MKNQLNEEKLKAHFTDEDKKTIEDTANEGLQFLESDPSDHEAIEKKKKELEAKFNPIMMRVYQAAGPEAAGAAGMGAGMGGGMPGAGGMGGGMPGAGSAPADTPMDDLD